MCVYKKKQKIMGHLLSTSFSINKRKRKKKTEPLSLRISYTSTRVTKEHIAQPKAFLSYDIGTTHHASLSYRIMAGPVGGGGTISGPGGRGGTTSGGCGGTTSGFGSGVSYPCGESGGFGPSGLGVGFGSGKGSS